MLIFIHVLWTLLFIDSGFAHELYIPERAKLNPTPPLVVLLHGCTQNPKSFLEITRMKSHADKAGFIILAPHKKISLSPPGNPVKCWSWYWDSSKRRNQETGDLKEIMTLVRDVKQKYHVDDKKVFVAGFSAGAVMSSIMASCYPDIFSGAAMHSGIPYRGLRWHLDHEIDIEDFFKHSELQRMEDVMGMLTEKELRRISELRKRRFHCARDVKKEDILLEDIVIFTGKRDKIAFSRSSPNTFFQFVPLDRSEWLKFSRIDGKPSYEILKNETSKPSVSLYQVNVMGHAWSGGREGYLFSDPMGPDATKLILEQFGLLFTEEGGTPLPRHL